MEWLRRKGVGYEIKLKKFKVAPEHTNNLNELSEIKVRDVKYCDKGHLHELEFRVEGSDLQFEMIEFKPDEEGKIKESGLRIYKKSGFYLHDGDLNAFIDKEILNDAIQKAKEHPKVRLIILTNGLFEAS